MESKKDKSLDEHIMEPLSNTVLRQHNRIIKLFAEVERLTKERDALEGALQHPDDPRHTCLFKKDRDRLAAELADEKQKATAIGAENNTLRSELAAAKAAVETAFREGKLFDFYNIPRGVDAAWLVSNARVKIILLDHFEYPSIL